MRTFPLPASRATGATLLLALAVAASGCAVTRDHDPTVSAERSPATPTATVTITETPPPAAPTTAAPSASPSPSAGGSEAALLAASDLTPLSGSAPWAEKSTGPAGTAAFGACQKFDLASIGAMTVVERAFAAGTDTAGQQVADFADAPTAVRAAKVLASWHDDCQGRLPGRRGTVGAITNVAVPAGTGWRYQARWVSGGSGHVHSFGMVLSGTRLTVLRIDDAGQDRAYEPGRDPMEPAVRTAAGKIGS